MPLNMNVKASLV
uniref:Uncharacterized protein n=1 Tax=Anguilla anguilla TaxID=7936 RepID=A0A0E9UFK1_ANGAN